MQALGKGAAAGGGTGEAGIENDDGLGLSAGRKGIHQVRARHAVVVDSIRRLQGIDIDQQTVSVLGGGAVADVDAPQRAARLDPSTQRRDA